jgi:CBS domain-containing protein
MLAREVMTSPVTTIRLGTPVPMAVALLLEAGVTAVPVLDSAGRLVGILSVLDLIEREVEADPRAHCLPLARDEAPLPRLVEDVMTADVIGVRDSADICDVVAVMVAERVTSVPVLSGDRVIGIISRRDVLRMLARSDDAIRQEVSHRIAEAGQLSAVVRVDDGVVSISSSGDPSRDLLAQLAARTVPGVLRLRESAATPR